MFCILFEMCFESLIWCLDWVACVRLSSCVSFPSWKTSFLQARLLLNTSSTNILSIKPSSCDLNRSLTASWSIEEIFEALYLPDKFLTDPRSIQIFRFSLDSSSTASQSVEILLHALFFTCFASFFYPVIHSILFHCIHAFIWIPCAPLIIFDHLYISRVKFYGFLYPLSIMTKKGRNTCLYKRELCFILLGGVFTSLLF